jgi:hypothetical protein
MPQQNRTILKSYFQTGDVPTEAQFIDLIDSSHNPSEDGQAATLTGTQTLTNKTMGATVYAGAQDFAGNQVENFVSKVMPAISGTLAAATHSGNVLITSGNVTIPATPGFNCVLIAGGAHTVTFNGAVSPALAAGDLMTIVVQSSTVIHAVRTLAADKVSFT